ncbi:MAG: hypothetical protein WAN48_15435, partial [Actinomycetes bacterium]
GEGAVGSLVVRGVYQRTCASDGWLTLGTGSRTVAPRVKLPDGTLQCAPMPQPRWDGTAWREPGWSVLSTENADHYDPTFGLVTDSVAAEGGCTTAVGPGAALMLANAQGLVSRYESGPDEVTTKLMAACPITAIDLGEVPPASPAKIEPDQASGAAATTSSRAQALRRLDGQVGSIEDSLPPGATLVLVTTADETAVARLRVLIARGPGPDQTTYATGLLNTASTRRPGLVQITDVTALALGTVQIPPVAPIVGAPPTVVPWQGSLSSLVDSLIELDERAQVIVSITFPINQAIIVIALAMYACFGLVGMTLARHRARRALTPTVPWALQRALQISSLVLASIPVATYCTNLVPWWRLADGPSTGRATAVMLLIAVVIAIGLTALAVIPPWQHVVFRPVSFVAAITVGVLAIDVLFGSNLQFATVLGLSPIAAGRFYGFGNVAFSIFATSAVFTAVAMSAPLVRQGRRLAAMLVVLGFGLLVGLIDGWPTFGADFGGMIDIIVGFGLFAVLISNRGLNWRRLLLILAAAAAFTAIVSLADWARPPESRSHLGDFVASLLAGDAGATVARKLSASLSSFTFALVAPLIPIAWAVLAWVVVAPQRFRATALLTVCERVPTLKAGLISVIVIAGLGALVNDSGVIVTATVMSIGAPLAVAAAADPRRVQPTPERSTSNLSSRG